MVKDGSFGDVMSWEDLDKVVGGKLNVSLWVCIVVSMIFSFMVK